MKTCAKQAISFWDYLGDRLGVPDAPAVPSSAELSARPHRPNRPVFCPYYPLLDSIRSG